MEHGDGSGTEPGPEQQQDVGAGPAPQLSPEPSAGAGAEAVDEPPRSHYPYQKLTIYETKVRGGGCVLRGKG